MGKDKAPKAPLVDGLLLPLAPPSSIILSDSSQHPQIWPLLVFSNQECHSPMFPFLLSGSPWLWCFALCPANSTRPTPRLSEMFRVRGLHASLGSGMRGQHTRDEATRSTWICIKNMDPSFALPPMSIVSMIWTPPRSFIAQGTLWSRSVKLFCGVQRAPH